MSSKNAMLLLHKKMDGMVLIWICMHIQGSMSVTGIVKKSRIARKQLVIFY